MAVRCRARVDFMSALRTGYAFDYRAGRSGTSGTITGLDGDRPRPQSALPERFLGENTVNGDNCRHPRRYKQPVTPAPCL